MADIAGVAIMQFIGQPEFGAAEARRNLGNKFLERVGLVTEALAEGPPQTRGVACPMAKLMQPRAVNAHVAYVPGIGFYADGNGREYMRLSYCYPEPDQIREGVRRLARVIEAELDLHSTFDTVDTGTFRAIPGHGSPSVPDVEPFVGPANSDRFEDRR